MEPLISCCPCSSKQPLFVFMLTSIAKLRWSHEDRKALAMKTSSLKVWGMSFLDKLFFLVAQHAKLYRHHSSLSYWEHITRSIYFYFPRAFETHTNHLSSHLDSTRKFRMSIHLNILSHIFNILPQNGKTPNFHKLKCIHSIWATK